MRKALNSLSVLILCVALAALVPLSAPVATAAQGHVAVAQGPAAATQETASGALAASAIAAPSLHMSAVAPQRSLAPAALVNPSFTPVCTTSCTPCPCRIGQGVCGFVCHR